MIIFYCYKCGERREFEKKADMRCECGHYVRDRERLSDNINMRKTWAKTTKVEFRETTMEQDIADRTNR